MVSKGYYANHYAPIIPLSSSGNGSFGLNTVKIDTAVRQTAASIIPLPVKIGSDACNHHFDLALRASAAMWAFIHLECWISSIRFSCSISSVSSSSMISAISTA